MLGRDVRGAGGGRDVSADDEVAAPTGEYPRVSSLGDENPSARPIESVWFKVMSQVKWHSKRRTLKKFFAAPLGQAQPNARPPLVELSVGRACPAGASEAATKRTRG